MALNFNFVFPKGYNWLIENKIMGFEPFSPMAPWYLLKAEKMYYLDDLWPQNFELGKLRIVFAQRQDCDDLACFEVVNNQIAKTIVVHTGTSNGYDITCELEDFWLWVKLVIDDIAELIDYPDEI